MTQHDFAEKIGRNDAWVSRYFDDAYDADLDTLKTMAESVGHTLNALFDMQPDEREQALLEAYRALQEEDRKMLLRTAQRWADLAHKGGRGRSRNLG